MSIIHDALKRVQQGLAPKTDDSQANPSPTTQNASAYIYDTPSKVENLPQTDQQTIKPRSAIKNKIKSIFALCCAIAITVTSIVYIYQQVQYAAPKAQTFAKSSFYKLIHKKEHFDFKTTPPKELKPLAQLTITPPTSSSTTKPGVPITLNIHGIMSNGTGNLVLINDQVYQEGDEVDGTKIVKINLNSITVINNGTEQTINVKS